MLLVLVLCVNPFGVHLTHIGLVLVTEVIHPADQVVPLVCEVLELLIKGQLVLAILNLLTSKMLQLRVEVPDTAVCCFMVCF